MYQRNANSGADKAVFFPVSPHYIEEIALGARGLLFAKFDGDVTDSGDVESPGARVALSYAMGFQERMYLQIGAPDARFNLFDNPFMSPSSVREVVEGYTVNIHECGSLDHKKRKGPLDIVLCDMMDDHRFRAPQSRKQFSEPVALDDNLVVYKRSYACKPVGTKGKRNNPFAINFSVRHVCIADNSKILSSLAYIELPEAFVANRHPIEDDIKTEFFQMKYSLLHDCRILQHSATGNRYAQLAPGSLTGDLARRLYDKVAILQPLPDGWLDDYIFIDTLQKKQF